MHVMDAHRILLDLAQELRDAVVVGDVREELLKDVAARAARTLLAVTHEHSHPALAGARDYLRFCGFLDTPEYMFNLWQHYYAREAAKLHPPLVDDPESLSEVAGRWCSAIFRLRDLLKFSHVKGWGDAFVPDAVQAAVLAALNGKCLTQSKLEAATRRDRSEIHRKGRMEKLKSLGLVVLVKGKGFYRPDAPPPESLSSH
jgi:hypothetical protein